MTKIKLAKINPELVTREIGDFMVDEITSIRYTGGVIGLSGGVDSTAAAAIAKKGFDRYNATHDSKLELVGYLLPSRVNNPKDTRDGITVAERLEIRHEIKSIENLVEAFEQTSPETMQSSYDKGNRMSEIRALILHGQAATEKKLVIGTGNHDEDFGIGYYTLFGDGAVHISPLGNLPKRLVRQLTTYNGFPDLAQRIPTAGLELGQTDFKDLGYDYDLIEIVGEGIRQGFSPEELITHHQVAPLANEQIQLYEQTFDHKKFENPEEIVQDILRRNKIAKAKAKIVHPPTAKITMEYE